jgi:hypothetical protein
VTLDALDDSTIEIRVAASKGYRLDTALSEAIVLALRKDCRVVLRFNDQVYPIDPVLVLAYAKRRLEC